MVKILGHRGARGLWTENTLAGFRNAADLGVDMVEFDVHLSSDGVPFVMHDALLDRTSHGTGAISRHSGEQLRRIKLRDSDETVPTLDDVLDLLAPTSVEFAIEIKTNIDCAPYDGLEAQIIAGVERRGLLHRTWILSFVPDCLERVRALSADVGLQACLWRQQADQQGGLARALDRLVGIPGAIAAVQEELFTLNETLCFSRMPAERIAVGINNVPSRLQYWLNRPVRHLSTDRPDIALAMRDEGRDASEY
ncbi:glycerophosphodiester phosphodiesterase family protein [Devosia nitrariae]|uniref:Glycerophosphoryl diester phosphodiesterase n=1 Tax=Devosia nitrariae TaxID=2071872 RepID=A0ABQ5W7N9_9HYPH|nr:glycerophosphodiester phosphodiesterase family protein [Devosia nitrariae]GLQ55819.1 glycerophosphoryl diester phosphodiesterase [Devosia nitrariae]